MANVYYPPPLFINYLRFCNIPPPPPQCLLSPPPCLLGTKEVQYIPDTTIFSLITVLLLRSVTSDMFISTTSRPIKLRKSLARCDNLDYLIKYNTLLALLTQALSGVIFKVLAMLFWLYYWLFVKIFWKNHGKRPSGVIYRFWHVSVKIGHKWQYIQISPWRN